MKTIRRSMIVVVAALLALCVQQASAQGLPGLLAQLLLLRQPILLGTTGACNNQFQGGPCTQTSTLVLLNPRTGALIKTIGPVGYTVNGLAWDRTTGRLYASTAIGDVRFHGLITINPLTGAGKPVNKNAVNFGLAGPDSPIHSINIDAAGHMVGWYDEFPPPDTYVRIDQKTGIATEFPGTGINTSQNGLAFGEFNLLWNIDAPREQLDGTVTQIAYLLNPFDGKPLLRKNLDPPTPAALGDFFPGTNLYYGLNFTAFDPLGTTFIEVVDPIKGTVTELGLTADNLHTLAFVP